MVATMQQRSNMLCTHTCAAENHVEYRNVRVTTTTATLPEALLLNDPIQKGIRRPAFKGTGSSLEPTALVNEQMELGLD